MTGTNNKVAFVSGGTYCRDICAALAKIGYSVGFLNDGGQDSNFEGEHTLGFKAENFSASELSTAVIETVEAFGTVDMLVFAGGAAERAAGSMILDIDDEQWDSCMNRSAKGFFLLVKYLLPYLISRPGSKVVVADIRGDSPDAASAAASAALEASARQMREELEACGIALTYRQLTSGDDVVTQIMDCAMG